MIIESKVEAIIERNKKLAELFVELLEHHRLGVSMNNREQETAIWGETEIKEWCDKGSEIMKAIASAPASSMSDIQLKARAAQMIVDLHNNGNDLNSAIEKADTYESMALSVVRDLLGSAA